MFLTFAETSFVKKNNMTTKALINSLVQQIAEIKQKVETQFLNLDTEMLNWKETPQQWSILECFEHLNRYNRYYNVALEMAIEKKKGIPDAVVYESKWLGKYFIQMMNPQNAKKHKTLKHLNPQNSKLNRDTLTEFITHQSHLLQLLDAANHVDVNVKAIPVEFLRILKLSIGDALRFLVVHEQRHLQQAENALQKQHTRHAELIV
jgi:hypothetical protein